MNLFHALGASLVGILFSVCTGGVAPAQADTRSEILDALAQRHPTQGADWWQALGPDTPRVIIDLLENQDGIYRRVRLVEALGFFPDSPEALAALKKQAQQSEDLVIKRTAVRVILANWGEKEIDWAVGFAKSDDAQMRIEVGKGLKKMQGAKATKSLDKILSDEPQLWVREHIRNGKRPLGTVDGGELPSTSERRKRRHRDESKSETE